MVFDFVDLNKIAYLFSSPVSVMHIRDRNTELSMLTVFALFLEFFRITDLLRPLAQLIADVFAEAVEQKLHFVSFRHKLTP